MYKKYFYIDSYKHSGVKYLSFVFEKSKEK